MATQFTLHHNESSGIFSAPLTVSVQVNRDLVVVLSHKDSATTAVVRHQTDRPAYELVERLDTALAKLNQKKGGSKKATKAKIFGLSTLHGDSLNTLEEWLKKAQVETAAKDIGKNVARVLSIDCGSGKVAVSYAESYNVDETPYLSAGTAQNRSTMRLLTSHHILVLGVSKVKRKLCAQAVEENPDCTAFTPERPFDDLMTSLKVPYAAIILLSDLGAGKPVEKWLKTLKKEQPNVPVVWIGKPPSNIAKNVIAFPALTPSSVRTFKTKLGTILEALESHEDTGRILLFSRK